MGRHLYGEVLVSGPRPLRAESQRRHSIAAGEYKVVLNWFEWNLPPQATTDWLPVEVELLLTGLTKTS